MAKRKGKKGRNAPCPCGSGKKYKYCCLRKPSPDLVRPYVEPPEVYFHKLGGELSQEWTKYRSAMVCLQKGQLRSALLELETLRQGSDLSPELRLDIEYGYGIALVENGDLAKARLVFNSLRESKGFGASHFQIEALSVEIAILLLVTGDYRTALVEIDRAIDSPALSTLRSGGCVAHIVRGQILTHLGDFQDAEHDLRAAVRIACELYDPENAGIAAEHLARLLLMVIRVREAKEWAVLAKRTYQEHAPHHFKTFGDLDEITRPEYAAMIPLDESAELALMAKMVGSFTLMRSADHLSIFDIDLLKVLQAVKADRGPIWVQIPLYSSVLTSQKLGVVLRDEILAARVEEGYPKLISDTSTAKLLGVTFGDLPQAYPSGELRWRVGMRSASRPLARWGSKGLGGEDVSLFNPREAFL